MTQFTISLHPETAARLKREAEARGVSAETVAAEMVEAWMSDDALDWEEDRRRLDEPGENIPAEEAFAEVESRLAARLAQQK